MKYLIILSFLLSGSLLSSHPHIWIVSDIHLYWENQSVRHVDIQWEFDSIFTQQILVDFDLDRSGDFSPQEVLDIEAGAFANLIGFGYFFYGEQLGQRVQVSQVKNFRAWMQDGVLYYEFTVELSRPLQGSFVLANADETNYVDFQLGGISQSGQNPKPEFERVFIEVGFTRPQAAKFF